MLGNAGGTIARAFGATGRDVDVDGVEIDPVVTEAAARYLGLHDNPRLHVVTTRTRGRSCAARTSATT